MAAQPHPIELLRSIDQRSRANAFGLPQQIEIKSTWEGLGFRLGDGRFVAPLGEIKEILTWPRMTKVPGAKSWVKGVANVRGNLLPVMDLQEFLGYPPSRLSRGSRVLVVHHKGIAAGLLVDEVLGLRHFFEEEFSAAKSDDAHLRDYLRGTYRQDGKLWQVFSLHDLVEGQAFMQVAA